MSTSVKQKSNKSQAIPKKFDPKRKAFKKKIFEKVDHDFIESLVEENPDIPNLKKYL